MSNDKVIRPDVDEKKISRMWKLWTKICMMIMDGKRDAGAVADCLQNIIDEPQLASTKWREEYDVIYFSVESDGTTGEDWIKRLEGNGFRVGDYAKQVLRSPDFKPTSGVTIEVAVLRGGILKDDDRTTKNIRAYAEDFRTPNNRKLSKPNAELACLICEKFAGEEIEAMGLSWIVAMHEPIANDSCGGPYFLHTVCDLDGQHWLKVCDDRPDNRWNYTGGFAFAVL